MLYFIKFKYTIFLYCILIYSLLGIDSGCDCSHGMNHCLSCNLLIAGGYSFCGFCELGTIRPSFIMAAFGEESLARVELDLCKDCFAVFLESDRDRRRKISVNLQKVRKEARDRLEARDEIRAADKYRRKHPNKSKYTKCDLHKLYHKCKG